MVLHSTSVSVHVTEPGSNSCERSADYILIITSCKHNMMYSTISAYYRMQFQLHSYLHLVICANCRAIFAIKTPTFTKLLKRVLYNKIWHRNTFVKVKWPIGHPENFHYRDFVYQECWTPLLVAISLIYLPPSPPSSRHTLRYTYFLWRSFPIPLICLSFLLSFLPLF